MTGDDKHIDKLFRNHLNGLREKPPVHSWKRLDNALDASILNKKLFYFRLIAASVLVFLAFGAGYFYALHLNQPRDVAERENPVQTVPENAAGPEETENKQVLLPGEMISDGDKSAPIPVDTETSPATGKILHATPPAQTAVLLSEADRQDESSIVYVAGDGPNPNTPAKELSGMAFIDTRGLQFQDPSQDARTRLFSSSSPAGLLFGYDDMLPYDFEMEPRKKSYAWALGAQFAPTYSYREISSNYTANPGGNPAQQDNYNNIEDALLSYAAGLNVDYNFSGNWGFQSGVYFSRIGQVNNDALQFQKNNNELILSAINTSTGYIDVAIERVPENVRKITSPKDTIDMSGVENVRVVQNFDLFEIPLMLRYKVLNRKFSIQLSGGLSPAYLVDNNTYLEMEDRKYDVGSSGNLNDFIVNTSLGLGLEYLVTKQLSVNFEPTFKYALNPINTNSNFSYHPYYFSWFTGIRFKIN